MASFDSVIDGWTSNVETMLDNILQDVVIDIGIAIVKITPVKTGRLRGNWQLTINSQATASLTTPDPDGSSTINEIISKAESLTSGDIAYIANNVLYGRDIEYGSSRKAPRGMVRVTEERFLSLVDAAIARRRFD
jgi:hypothetical protein